MTNTTAPEVIAKEGPYAQMRTGTISSFTTNQAIITAGGSTFIASYLEGAPLSEGALVACLHQQGSWLILGVLAGVGENLLAAGNPSFENSAPGSFPAMWFQANLSGVAIITVVTDPNAPAGTQVAEVTGPAVGTQSYLYSQPIQVTAGDMFTVSAYAGGQYTPSDALTADAAVAALWFANDTNLYPTTSSPDIVISTFNNLVQAPPYATLGGSVTAPVTGFMRIALRSVTEAGQAVRWAAVIVRRA